MSEATSDKDALLAKIKAKRQQISDYLTKMVTRHSWLINVSIIAGAFAAALTAGPGVGGEGFIGVAKGVVSLGIPIWQVLCSAATLLSLTAVITNGMLKSYDHAAKIADAKKSDSKLEAIETMLEFGQIDVKKATQQYTQCLADLPRI